MRIGWVGFHEEGMLALEALLKRGGLVGVITLKQDKAAKRSAAADVEGLCRAAEVPVHLVDHIDDADAVAVMKSWQADVIFVIGWSQILGEEALSQAKIGTIGAHASKLPHNRGSAPINWAIINGESETGNSLMWLAADVDNGDLIDQMSFPISTYDTCATLYQRVAETNRDMILRSLERFEAGDFPRQPQEETGEPILPRRRPRDGKMDWTQTAEQLYAFVRALARPYPGAFTRLDGTPEKRGKKHIVWNTALIDMSVPTEAAPGTVVGHLHSPIPEACGLLVACGKGVLAVLEVETKDGIILSGPELCRAVAKGAKYGA